MRKFKLLNLIHSIGTGWFAFFSSSDVLIFGDIRSDIYLPDLALDKW